MQHVTRFILTLLLAVSLSGVASAKTALKVAEYKRSDANFYWKGDVLKVDPTATILPMSSFTQKADSYFFTPKIKAPKELYVQVVNDWVEPITPPNMPASLDVPPDAMQIREPQGDVQVAFPSAPATFLPVKDGMTIPNGSVVKTGANGTAAILFGGVDSARLIPNSEAAVQQTVAATLRSTEVDLTRGAVFSKVGTRIGVKEDYKVHTPFGVAAARGTDFVSVVMPARTDVWIAQGTVQLDSPDGKTVGTIKSDGTGALKIIRYPLMPDMHQAMMASAETMTTAMNFIPMVNLKLKALHDKMAMGVKLTASEADYMGRIKKVPCLIKLTMVEPPPAPVPAPAAAPAPAPAPQPKAPAPVLAPMPGAPAVAANSAPSSQSIVPVLIDLHADGEIDLNGLVVSLDDLKSKLTALATANPAQTIAITGRENVPKDQYQKVRDLCRAAKLKQVKPPTPPKVAPGAPANAGTPVPTPTPAATPAPVPATPAASVSTPAMPAPAVTTPTTPAPTPIPLNLRADGKVDFQGETLSLDDLKPKLEAFAKATPNQPIMITGRENTTSDQLHKVHDLCKAAHVKTVHAPKPATAPANGAAPGTTPAAATKPATPAPAAAPAPKPQPAPVPAPPAPSTNAPAQTIP